MNKFTYWKDDPYAIHSKILEDRTQELKDSGLYKEKVHLNLVHGLE